MRKQCPEKVQKNASVTVVTTVKMTHRDCLSNGEDSAPLRANTGLPCREEMKAGLAQGIRSS